MLSLSASINSNTYTREGQLSDPSISAIGVPILGNAGPTIRDFGVPLPDGAYTPQEGADWGVLDVDGGVATFTPGSLSQTLLSGQTQSLTYLIGDTTYRDTVEGMFLALWSNGEQGAFYERAASAHYEDLAGTIPATLDGPVGRWEDLSGNGNHGSAPSDAGRMTLRANALEPDRIDDNFSIPLGQNFQGWFCLALTTGVIFGEFNTLNNIESKYTEISAGLPRGDILALVVLDRAFTSAEKAEIAARWPATSAPNSLVRAYDGRNDLISIDLSGYDQTNVNAYNLAFYNALNVQKITIGSAPTGSVDLAYMFYSTLALAELDLAALNAANIISLRQTFDRSAVPLDLSGLQTQNTTNWYRAFRRRGDTPTLGIEMLDVSSATNMTQIFAETNISQEQYDAILENWGAQTVQPNVKLDLGSTQYTGGSSAAAAGRAALVAQGWTITDGGPTAVEPTLFLGAETLAGEGGFAVTTADLTGQPNYELVSGRVQLTAAGATALNGSAADVDVTLNIDGSNQLVRHAANVKHVRNDAELQAASSNISEGMTVIARDGQYGPLTVASQAWTNSIVIEPENDEEASIESLVIEPQSGAPDITFGKFSSQALGVEPEFAARITVETNPTPVGDLTLNFAKLSGRDGTDPYSDKALMRVDVTGVVGTFAAGETLTGTGTGAGELNGPISLLILKVEGNTLFLSDSPEGNDGGTVDTPDSRAGRIIAGTALTSSGGATAQAVGPVYSEKEPEYWGILCNGRAFDNITVNDTVFRWFTEACRISADQQVTVNRPLCVECSADFIKTPSHSDANPIPSQGFRVFRAIHKSPTGRKSDHLNPHVDGAQMLAGSVTANWQGVEYVDCVFMTDGRADEVQPIFNVQGTGASVYENPKVHHCLMDNGLPTQISFDKLNNGEFIGNTGPRFTTAALKRRYNIGSVSATGTQTFTGNVGEVLELGGSEVTPSGNVFAGDGFDWSSTYPNMQNRAAASFAELLSFLTPAPNSIVLGGPTYVFGTSNGAVTEAGRMIGADGTDITDEMAGIAARCAVPARPSDFTLTRISNSQLELEILSMTANDGEAPNAVKITIGDQVIAQPFTGLGIITVNHSAQGVQTQLAKVQFVNTDGDSPPSEEVPVDGGTISAITVNDFARDSWVFDVGAAVSRDTARIPVNGSITPAIEGISIRARQAGTTVAGQIIGTTAEDGTFTGHMTALEDGLDHQLEVFVDGDVAINATTSNTYSTGHHIHFYGQSQWSLPFFHTSTVLPPINVADTRAVEFLMMDENADTETTAPNPLLLKVGDAGVTDSMQYMANVYAAFAPGKRFLVVDAVEAGTAAFNGLFADGVGRHWSSVASRMNYIRNVIGDTSSLNLWSWFGSDQNLLASGAVAADDYAPGFFKRATSGGVEFTLGTTGTAGTQIDHCFFDDFAPSGQRGEGLFADDEAVFAVAPHVFRVLSDTAESRFNYDAQAANQEILIGQIRDWTATDPRLRLLPDMANVRLGNNFTGTWGDQYHPTIDDVDGQRRALAMLALYSLMALGIVPQINPVMTLDTWAADTATFNVNVGVGNKLTTLAIERGEADNDQRPWFADIAGFEFSRGGVFDHPTVVAITDDGSASGTATITVTRANENGDTVTFLAGGGLGHLSDDGMELGYNTRTLGVLLAGDTTDTLVPVAAGATFADASGISAGSSIGGAGSNLFADETFTDVDANWNVTGGGWTQVNPNGIAKVSGISFQSFRQFAFQLIAGTEYTFAVNVSDVSVLDGNVRFDVSNSSTFNIEVPLALGELSVTFTPTTTGPHNLGFISRSGSAVFEVDEVYIGTTN